MMLRKSNCSVEVVTLKKFEATPKIKLSWKIGNIREKINFYLKEETKLD